MKKNYFVYYGTEENAFEVEKNGAYTKDVAIEVAKEYLKDYMLDEDLPYGMKDIDKGEYVTFESKQGYTMFVGVEVKGNLRKIRSKLADMRREFIAMM